MRNYQNMQLFEILLIHIQEDTAWFQLPWDSTVGAVSMEFCRPIPKPDVPESVPHQDFK